MRAVLGGGGGADATAAGTVIQKDGVGTRHPVAAKVSLQRSEQAEREELLELTEVR